MGVVDAAVFRPSGLHGDPRGRPVKPVKGQRGPEVTKEDELGRLWRLPAAAGSSARRLGFVGRRRDGDEVLGRPGIPFIGRLRPRRACPGC